MTGALRSAPVLLVLTVLVGLPGCTWDAREPGLFTTPPPRPSPTSSPSSVEPAPTDPRLPVVGEVTWTSAEGNDVTVRLAVHAVRRTSTATVLDWSVTPLAGFGREAGEPLPAGTDLALDRALPGQQNLALLDTRAERAYRPLAHVSPRLVSRCLCTPLFAVLPELRFGETRVLQLAFPTLPSAASRVDVVLPDLEVVAGVPVTPVGEVPVARTPTDLARPADGGSPATDAQLYALPDGSGDLETVVVDRVVAGPGLTSVGWTLASVDDQDTRTRAVPPVAAPLPAGVRVATEIPASGPRLRVPGAGKDLTGARWTTATSTGGTAYECLCSGLGLWSRGLRAAGGTARLTTQVGPLPAGTSHVDVLFPGLHAFRRVPVTRVGDADTLPTRSASSATWTYDATDPPRGWSTQDWPTPLPAADQVADYASRPERVVDALPGS